MRPAKLKAALEGAVSEPAWRKKPSRYLVATDDRMIPPPAQAMMAKRAGATVVESKGSHAIYVSRPESVNLTSTDKVCAKILSVSELIPFCYFLISSRTGSYRSANLLRFWLKQRQCED